MTIIDTVKDASDFLTGKWALKPNASYSDADLNDMRRADILELAQMWHKEAMADLPDVNVPQTSRNTIPADHYDVLKRLLNCNWNQLADHLEVTPQTLKIWRDGEGSKNAAEKCQNLMDDTLNAAGAGWLLLPTNWPRN